MSYNLFLDDLRKPHHVKWVELPLVEWTIAKSYNDFVRIVSSLGMPLRVAFDNDLADEHYEALINRTFEMKQNENTFKEKTGYDCAKWLVNYCMERGLPFPEYYVHTMNPIGKENITQYIENFKRL